MLLEDDEDVPASAVGGLRRGELEEIELFVARARPEIVAVDDERFFRGGAWTKRVERAR
ncbi:MAG: hypothetical protein H0X34_10290 [Chthoniobacterales bacterium]|nr:hypothetical protein [Chthoniobacterales bacterium]